MTVPRVHTEPSRNSRRDRRPLTDPRHRTRKMRGSAVAQLAAEIPPAMAGDDWTRYAASTARPPAHS